MTASGFMARLPTFPSATVDEILDIRTDLASPLTHFRSEMVAISRQFTSESWERGFDDEVHDAWVERVQPAVQNIDESVRDNRSLLTQATNWTSVAKAALPGLAICGAGQLSHLGAMEIAGAATTVVGPILEAMRQSHTTRQSLKMQPFYFLYGIQRALDE
jgi:hypothetical protein